MQRAVWIYDWNLNSDRNYLFIERVWILFPSPARKCVRHTRQFHTAFLVCLHPSASVPPWKYQKVSDSFMNKTRSSGVRSTADIAAFPACPGKLRYPGEEGSAVAVRRALFLGCHAFGYCRYHVLLVQCCLYCTDDAGNSACVCPKWRSTVWYNNHWLCKCTPYLTMHIHLKKGKKSHRAMASFVLKNSATLLLANGIWDARKKIHAIYPPCFVIWSVLESWFLRPRGFSLQVSSPNKLRLVPHFGHSYCRCMCTVSFSEGPLCLFRLSQKNRVKSFVTKFKYIVAYKIDKNWWLGSQLISLYKSMPTNWIDIDWFWLIDGWSIVTKSAPLIDTDCHYFPFTSFTFPYLSFIEC